MRDEVAMVIRKHNLNEIIATFFVCFVFPRPSVQIYQLNQSGTLPRAQGSPFLSAHQSEAGGYRYEPDAREERRVRREEKGEGEQIA